MKKSLLFLIVLVGIYFSSITFGDNIKKSKSLAIAQNTGF